MNRRKVLGTTGAIVAAMPLLSACASGTGEDGEGGGGTKKVGIAMPTNTAERWNNDGANLDAALKEAGYETVLQFADDKPDIQITQIENMISQGVDALVIASIDGEALSGVLATAKENDITVIAYDRLITSTENVDYYATFDNYQVGVIQGQFLIDALQLETEEGPFNIELFAGSLTDNNAYYFWNGAIDTLEQYINAGKLVVKSGQTDIEQTAIELWETGTAQNRMDDLLSTHYGDEKVQAILSPADILTLGIIASLDSAGYTADDYPIITGQDADIAAVQNIIDGKQTQTVFKDTRTLADKAVEMVVAVFEGTEVPVNNTTDYDNKVKVVDTFLLEPVSIDIENWEQVLITDTAYYEASEFNVPS